MVDFDDNELRGLVQKIMVFHAWVEKALFRINRCYEGALDGGDLRALAIIGESGAGKSKILEHFERNNSPKRNKEGLKVPVLLAKIQSKPTVKGLVEELLFKIGDPLFDKGTENSKTIRLKKLLKAAETRLLMLDEFQHFVDQGSQKVQHYVADWLKILVDDTKVGLVVAGLPYCMSVIETNSQLKRRFQAPVEMPRFNWRYSEHRMEFRDILSAMQSKLKPFELPDLYSEEIAFRFYYASGGLIGRVSNILIEATLNAIEKKCTKITLSDLGKAAKNSSFDMPFGKSNPFGRNFNVLPTDESISEIMAAGSTEFPIDVIAGNNYTPNRLSEVLRT